MAQKRKKTAKKPTASPVGEVAPEPPKDERIKRGPRLPNGRIKSEK